MVLGLGGMLGYPPPNYWYMVNPDYFRAGQAIPVPQGMSPYQYANSIQNMATVSYTATSDITEAFIKRAKDLCICPHYNCPICEKRAVYVAETNRKVEAETQRKMEEYKKRCSDYMSKFRRKYEQVKKKNSHSG